MSLYLYIDGEGWMHRLHPATRLAGAMALFAIAFWADRPLWQLPVLGFVGGLVWSTGSFANIWRLRHLFLVVFVMTFVIWTLFFGSDGAPPLWTLGPIAIARTAPAFALAMALKLSAFLAVGTVFLSTTRVEEFAYALGCFGLPRKVGFAITLAFRLVPVFLQTAQTVVEAQRCRGLSFEEGSLLQRLRRYVPIMVPVFMGALRRTDGLAMALDGRGFQLVAERSTYRQYRVGSGDAVYLAVLAVLMSVYLYLRHTGLLAFS